MTDSSSDKPRRILTVARPKAEAKPAEAKGAPKSGSPWSKTPKPDAAKPGGPRPSASRPAAPKPRAPKPGAAWANAPKPAASKPGAPPSAPATGDDPWARWRQPEPAASSAEAAPERPVPKASSEPRIKPAAAPAAAPATDRSAEGVRLSKVMSERGLCSRREADAWIEQGWVFVDGQRITELGTRIDPGAEITLAAEAKKDQARQVTVLLHKPVGYVSGQPEPGCIPAITLVTAENQVQAPGDPEFRPYMLRSLAPAGRLDVDSTGLLVLTQDGRIARQLIGDDSPVEKEYLVRVAGQMIPNGLALLNHGLELDGKPLKPARVKQLNEDQLHFILREGKKRQIRRMCELVGLKVTGLKRVRIGRLRLGDLPPGKWRFLREGEGF